MGRTRTLHVVVTWDDTQKLIAALNVARPDKNFRLPSEIEWEYACHAGSGTPYFWGDAPDTLRMTDHAWVPANSGDSTHPVGQLELNVWACHQRRHTGHEAEPGGFLSLQAV